MVTNIIFALVVIALIAGVFYWLWKLSKWLVIPIQIILFITLVVIVIKVFVNKENAEKLHKEITNSGIVEVENRVIKETTNSFKKVLTTSDKAVEENKTVVADAKANATTVATQQATKIEQAVSNNVKETPKVAEKPAPVKVATQTKPAPVKVAAPAKPAPAKASPSKPAPAKAEDSFIDLL